MWGERLFACAMLFASAEFAQQPRVAPHHLAKRQMLLNAQVAGVSGDNLLADIALVLFEYQKMAGKEAREDSKTAGMMKELVAQQKAAKLQNDNNQIEKQMDEASQKAQDLMDAANTALVAGIVSGAAQVGAGVTGGLDPWKPYIDHLRSVQATVRVLRQRTPIPGRRGAAGLDLQRSIDRFAQLRTRLAATSKLVNDELRKLGPN